MTTPIEIALLIGRVLLGGYFVNSGINHFRHHQMMVGYAATKKVPVPQLAIPGTGVLLTVGGLSVLLGVYPLVGLALLALFFVGVTPMMHNFWTVSDPMQKMGEQVNFMKNVALLGSVLALMALPQPWTFSLPIGV